MKRELRSLLLVVIGAALGISALAAKSPMRRTDELKRDLDMESHDGIVPSKAAFLPQDPDIEAVWVGTTQWISGVNWGGETFAGSIGKGENFFGSSLTGPDYVPVKLDFSNSTTTLCQTFRRDLGYSAAGVGTFPGAAYDMSNPGSPRRLNICFVEDNVAGAPDHIWNPNATGSPTFGKREYIAIMLSSYDGSGTTYSSFDLFDDASSMDILYNWWPQLISGFTLLQVLPASIQITPYLIKNVNAIPDNGTALLNWFFYTDPDSFVIYGAHSTPPANAWIGSVAGVMRDFPYGSLTNGDTYYFRIEAFDGGAVSGASRQFSTVPGVYYSNMTRFGTWNDRSEYGGIWGYVDSVSGNEYALICCRNEGVAIIDVNVSPPVEVGFMPSITPERDAKEVQVYRHYAIVVKESEDLQVFDLTNVANPVQVSTIVPDNNGSHTCLIDGRYLYVAGNHGVGGLEIFDIVNPAAPVELGGYQPYYYHDYAIHNDTIYGFAIYGEGIDVIDVSNKNSPSLITTFNYPGSGTHNGIITADGKHMFVGDEIGVSGNHTRVFDISDINNVSIVANIIVNPSAIAHNCYLRGDLLFIGHYTEGCRVFEVSDPVNPVEVAYYDTWLPATFGYDGMWTAYPLLPSGKIIASDRSTGLWVFTMEDTDSDGIFDVTDNCVDDPNPTQTDLDADGIGDVCDPCVCPCANDPVCDGAISDVLDLVAAVNVAFRNIPAEIDGNCPRERTDVDASGVTDVGDVVRIITVAFRNGQVVDYYVDPCP